MVVPPLSRDAAAGLPVLTRDCYLADNAAELPALAEVLNMIKQSLGIAFDIRHGLMHDAKGDDRPPEENPHLIGRPVPLDRQSVGQLFFAVCLSTEAAFEGGRCQEVVPWKVKELVAEDLKVISNLANLPIDRVDLIDARKPASFKRRSPPQDNAWMWSDPVRGPC